MAAVLLLTVDIVAMLSGLYLTIKVKLTLNCD